MLTSPHKTFAGVSAFLGLKVPRDRLDKAIKLSSFKVLREQEKRHGFIERTANRERFFREGKAGQWRRPVSAQQIEPLTPPIASRWPASAIGRCRNDGARTRSGPMMGKILWLASYPRSGNT